MKLQRRSNQREIETKSLFSSRAMAILYALVARGTVVLAEFSAVTGNTGAVARRIIEKLPNEADTRLCFSQDGYIFHILRIDGLTFLCMANDTSGSAYLPLSLFFSLFYFFVIYFCLIEYWTKYRELFQFRIELEPVQF